MEKMMCWGPSVGLPTTPLCITPQLGVKTVYLSTAQLTNWRRKLVYEITPDRLKVFINQLKDLKDANMFVQVHNCVPDEVLEFLEEVEKEDTTLYITIPLYATPPRRYSAHIFVMPPYNLMITKCVFSSLYAMHFITGMQVTDLITDKCKCFTMINAPLKIMVDNKEVSPCSICKHNTARIGKYCYLYNTNYACLFHAGDLPEFNTEVGNEQLAALMNSDLYDHKDIDDIIKEDSYKTHSEKLAEQTEFAINAWETSEEGV